MEIAFLQAAKFKLPSYVKVEWTSLMRNDGDFLGTILILYKTSRATVLMSTSPF
jgi:hypothetical protein